MMKDWLANVERPSSYTRHWGAETRLRELAYKIFLEQGIQVPVQCRIVQMQPHSPSPV